MIEAIAKAADYLTLEVNNAINTHAGPLVRYAAQADPAAATGQVDSAIDCIGSASALQDYVGTAPLRHGPDAPTGILVSWTDDQIGSEPTGQIGPMRRLLNDSHRRSAESPCQRCTCCPDHPESLNYNCVSSKHPGLAQRVQAHGQRFNDGGEDIRDPCGYPGQ